MPAASPTSIKLDPELKGRVQALAAEQRRSPHWLMREAIARYVEREEAEAEFRRAAVEAWDEYQRTGLYVPGDVMDAWMTAVANGEDPPMPEPCVR